MCVNIILLLLLSSTLCHSLTANNDPHHKIIKLYNDSRNFTMGTNPHLDEIFIGRCYAVLGYTLSSSLSPSSSLSSSREMDPLDVCSKLWSLFSDAFQYKNDSDILPSSFLPYFSHPLILSSLTSSPNTALFWSGVSNIIPTYQTATNQFVMETSSLVEIVGDLMFCGSTTDASGFDYESCIWGDYNTTGDNQWHGSWVSYWAAASLAYAPLANGNITILLRGSPSPYRRSSFFATCELPNLPVDNITGVHVLVAPAEDGAPYDKCGEGSLNELVSDLTAHGIDDSIISCTNDPPLIQLMDCLSTPLSSQCLLM